MKRIQLAPAILCDAAGDQGAALTWLKENFDSSRHPRPDESLPTFMLTPSVPVSSMDLPYGR
jgi:hypothetical protein